MRNFGLVYGPKPTVKEVPYSKSEMYKTRNRDALKRFQAALGSFNSGISVNGRYSGRGKPCDFQCSEGHFFSRRPDNLIRAVRAGKQPCPDCDGRPNGRLLEPGAKVAAAEHQEKLDSFGTGIKIVGIDELGEVGRYRDAKGKEFVMSLKKMIKSKGFV